MASYSHGIQDKEPWGIGNAARPCLPPPDPPRETVPARLIAGSLSYSSGPNARERPHPLLISPNDLNRPQVSCGQGDGRGGGLRRNCLKSVPGASDLGRALHNEVRPGGAGNA